MPAVRSRQPYAGPFLVDQAGIDQTGIDEAGIDGVRIEEIGEALLLRTEADQPGPLAALASALPPGGDHVVLVSAPSVTERADFFDILPDLLAEHLGGSGAGVRLVALGEYADPRAAEDSAGRLARHIGLEVLAPLGPVSVTAGATAVAARPGTASGWVRCTRDGRRWHEPPWWPLPGWASGPSPGTTPAHPPRVRAAIEPYELPGTPTRAGWSFRTGGAAIGHHRCEVGFLVEVEAGAGSFVVDGSPVQPAELAKMIDMCRPGRVPAHEAVVVVVVTYGTAVPDWAFVSLADALGVPVVAADAEVSLTPTGMLNTSGEFRRWSPRSGGDGPPPASGRAQMLGPALPAMAEPVPLPLPVPRPPPAAPPMPVRAPMAARPWWQAVPVTGPAPAHSVTRPAGPRPLEPPQAITGSLVRLVGADRWRAPERGGAILAPPPHAPPTAAPPTAAVAPMAEAADASGVADRSLAATPPALGIPQVMPIVPILPLAAPPGGTDFGPLWIGVGGWRDDDEAALRRALGGRYDVHARLVIRTLAEEPGLRAVGASADLVAALVALRAYCTDERDAVNAALRVGADRVGAQRARLLARCASHGLRRLPTVLGPVFRAVPVPPAIASSYQPGAELVEPGFVDADLVPTRSTDATVEFVIWSLSGHRLDRLGAQPGAGVLFEPATRFAVVAVEPPERGGMPVRVLLRESFGISGASGDPERVVRRLRAAPRPDQGGPDAPAYLPIAPGLDSAGSPYAPYDAPYEGEGAA